MSHANTRSELWQFDALDSWFFRESRPLDAVGGAQLSSLFPPPARTVVGAVRTTLGEAANVDWQAFKRDPDHAVRRLIGSPQDPAPLSFVGPYLLKDGKRLYPAPLLLLGTC